MDLNRSRTYLRSTLKSASIPYLRSFEFRESATDRESPQESIYRLGDPEHPASPDRSVFETFLADEESSSRAKTPRSIAGPEREFMLRDPRNWSRFRRLASPRDEDSENPGNGDLTRIMGPRRLTP